MTYLKTIFITISMVLLLACADSSTATASSSITQSPSAAEILGNPDYPAFSYGGYREKTRDVVPTKDEIKDDVRILAALGIKILRTYNTSQYPQAERLLAAIHELKAEDENFEMYVMLGAWIDCRLAWTDHADHSQGSIENNTAEIGKAVELANQYPDIVKVIAVGNEAMVQWAVDYFVYPKTILKWVNHLQALKSTGKLPADLWVTSSDNFESWGGGDKVYQTEDLASLIKAVDYVSLHTYPFHDSHYDPVFWGVLAEEESLSQLDQIEAVMLRAKQRAISQFQGAADYIKSVDADKPIHIGETGWASIAGSSYGITGSHAADELKEKLYYQHMRDWGNEAGMSVFYFEIFDEQWKDAGEAAGSENHFGLITLDNKVKYTLWDEFDQGAFDGLTRNGKPLTKSFGGDEAALMDSVLPPPYKSKMPKRKITTINENAVPGEPVTADFYIISLDKALLGEGLNTSYPSSTLKITPWEGTCNIIMTAEDVIEITTGTGDWWGNSLGIESETGENLTSFGSGHIILEMRGDPELSFEIGYQTGHYLAGNQVDNSIEFGPGHENKLEKDWKYYKIPMSKITQMGANLTDVTNVLYLKGDSPDKKTKMYIRNIFYWDEFDQKVFDDLTQNGKPLTKSFDADKVASIEAAPPAAYQSKIPRSKMPRSKITKTNENAVLGEPVTADFYIVTLDESLLGADLNTSYPSSTLKITAWESTCYIIMTAEDVIEITTGTGDWWGSSLSIEGETGENLTQFKSGHIILEMRGDPELSFEIGYQTGHYLENNQVDNAMKFGPKRDHKLEENWKYYKIPMSKITKRDADLTNVSNVLYLKSDSSDKKMKMYIRNIFYSKK